MHTRDDGTEPINRLERFSAALVLAPATAAKALATRTSAVIDRRPALRRLTTMMRDTSRRNIYFSAAAIPGHLLVAASKGVLLFATPSLFMLANVLFTLGLAVVKGFVISADRRRLRDGDIDAARRAYRASGLLLVVMAIVYAACCLPLALGTTESQRYEQPVAIGIATIAFAELGFSVHGFFSSRKHEDLLMEAVKLSNLACALVLLVLTQTALLSLTESDQSTSLYTGWCGLVMGGASAGIGVVMLARRVKYGAIATSETAPPSHVGSDESQIPD